MQPNGAAPWDPAQQAAAQQAAAQQHALQAAAQQHAQAVQPGQQVMVTGQPVAIPVSQAAGMAHGQPMMMGQGQMMMAQNPPKQLLIGVLLALFLGAFGAHNFYLGYTGRAVAQLLITVLTFGIGGIISGIWALVELIMMATGSLPDAEGRPLV
jgi:TM2 domain-containing membrane protein YozV